MFFCSVVVVQKYLLFLDQDQFEIETQNTTLSTCKNNGKVGHQMMKGKHVS